MTSSEAALYLLNLGYLGDSQSGFFANGFDG